MPGEERLMQNEIERVNFIDHREKEKLTKTSYARFN